MVDFKKSNSNTSSNESTKKPRFSESGFLQNIENLSSTPENFQLLSVLFPVLPESEVKYFLKESLNDLDLAIKRIQEREKLRYFDQEFHKKAVQVCERLTFSSSYFEATEVIKNFIRAPQSLEIDSQLEEKRVKIESRIKETITENAKFKKIVVWLTEKSKSCQENERELVRLQKQLEYEKCRSYSLACQLNHALGTQEADYC